MKQDNASDCAESDLSPSSALPTEAELIEPSRRAIARGLKPWAKGESGNISGYSRIYAASRKMFRDRSPELADRLLWLALNAVDERVSAMCTVTGLGIAGLRPSDYDPSSEKQPVPFDAAKLSPERRQLLRELLQEMHTPTAEGESAKGAGGGEVEGRD